MSALLASACATTATHPRPQMPAAAPTAKAAVAPSAGPRTSDADDEDDAASATTTSAESTEGTATEAAGPCPADMALVAIAGPTPQRFCVDKYEASLVEVSPDGTERPFPHYTPVDGHEVRAVSKPHVFPQGYISEVQAQDACAASGKRLCNPEEWKTACMGPSHTTFPYGEARRPGACHDTGKSAVMAVFGAKAVAASTPFSAANSGATAAAPAPTSSLGGKRAHSTKGRAAQSSHARVAAKIPGKTVAASKTVSKKAKSRPGSAGKKSTRPASVDPGVWARLNDPALGQVDGALAKTGEHDECVNDFGVFDMVGNLHEWVATDPAAPHGTFSGGYYLDTTINGDGCNYRTRAHAHDYHDYSTGFRCCSSAKAGE